MGKAQQQQEREDHDPLGKEANTSIQKDTKERINKGHFTAFLQSSPYQRAKSKLMGPFVYQGICSEAWQSNSFFISFITTPKMATKKGQREVVGKKW